MADDEPYDRPETLPRRMKVASSAWQSPEHLFKVGYAAFAAAMEIQVPYRAMQFTTPDREKHRPLEDEFLFVRGKARRYRYLSKANRVKRS